MHLLIIDGLNLIRRVHAAVPGDETAKVQGALISTSQALVKLLNRFQPSHAVVCFDGPELSWRHIEFPDYKAKRKPMPESLRQSLRAFRELFSEQGIASLAMSAVEADDLAATLCCKMRKLGGDVTLVSTDKGFAQLLSAEAPGSLQIWNHFDRQVVDESVVQEKFSVRASQLIDYWGLAGDSTNQIPGVAGIGAKTAAQLLNEYGSVDAIYASLDQISSQRQQGLLQKGEQQARLSQRLVCLQQDLKLGCNLRDLRCKTGSYPET